MLTLSCLCLWLGMRLSVVKRKMLQLQLIALVNYMATFIWHLNSDSICHKRVLMVFYGNTIGNWQLATGNYMEHGWGPGEMGSNNCQKSYRIIIETLTTTTTMCLTTSIINKKSKKEKEKYIKRETYKMHESFASNLFPCFNSVSVLHLPHAPLYFSLSL